MIKILADGLVPIFAGLLLGYIAGLRGVLNNQNVRNLIAFVMSFAVPCSLFLSIAQTPRAALREQVGAALVLAFVYFVLFAVTFFWARSGQKAGQFGECRPGADGQLSQLGRGGLSAACTSLRVAVLSHSSNLHRARLHHYFRDHAGDPRRGTGPFWRRAFSSALRSFSA